MRLLLLLNMFIKSTLLATVQLGYAGVFTSHSFAQISQHSTHSSLNEYTLVSHQCHMCTHMYCVYTFGVHLCQFFSYFGTAKRHTSAFEQARELKIKSIKARQSNSANEGEKKTRTLRVQLTVLPFDSSSCRCIFIRVGKVLAKTSNFSSCKSGTEIYHKVKSRKKRN